MSRRARAKINKPWWQRKWGTDWAQGPACQPLGAYEAQLVEDFVRSRLGMASGQSQTDFCEWAASHGYGYHQFWSPAADGAVRSHFIFLCDGRVQGELPKHLSGADIAVFEDEVRALVPHVYLSPEQLSPPAAGPRMRPSALSQS